MNQANTSSICQEKQFEEVYQEQVDAVYHFSYYKCGNKALAEDLLQEAFLVLWENCATVSFATAKAFLFKVIRNRYLNKVERKKVVRKYEQHIQLHPDVESPEYIMEKKEFYHKLSQAINKLPDTQKEVFLLNRIDQLKYR
ncbi:MAG: sigma-70 family RNA polymerase sigma factor, partial [Bacteroidota bacterium]